MDPWLALTPGLDCLECGTPLRPEDRGEPVCEPCDRQIGRELDLYMLFRALIDEERRLARRD